MTAIQTSNTAEPDFRSVPQLGWQAAQRAVAGAARHAEAIGACVNVTLLDAGGNPLAALRMPGAPLHSIGISADKAYTAASFGLPTADWGEVLRQHSDAVRQGLPLRPRFVMFGGGLPIRHQGVLVGAIGVSGGSEQQDDDCARAGLAAAGMST
ncbi:cobalamin adenosyltransferase [Janthinobacterium sp. BJB412]|nr:cobalamin adenosyltransferase [Janthinobacterium sp. BJB412]